MKRLILTAALLQTMLYPTLPGTTVRDYSQPGIRVEGNQIYQTYPGTTVRDYSGQSYRIEPQYTIRKGEPLPGIIDQRRR